MDIRHPVRTITWALQNALEADLAGVANDLLRHDPSTPPTRRPCLDECSVVMFGQSWTGAALGFADKGRRDSIEADTVVIAGPAGDACVYVSTQLLYRVRHPNRRFFMDVAAQCMGAKSERHLYEGRDNEDLESVSYDVEAALSQMRGAVNHVPPEQALRVARVLHGFARKFEARGRSSATSGG